MPYTQNPLIKESILSSPGQRLQFNSTDHLSVLKPIGPNTDRSSVYTGAPNPRNWADNRKFKNPLKNQNFEFKQNTQNISLQGIAEVNPVYMGAERPQERQYCDLDSSGMLAYSGVSGEPLAKRAAAGSRKNVLMGGYGFPVSRANRSGVVSEKVSRTRGNGDLSIGAVGSGRGKVLAYGNENLGRGMRRRR
jgi:hypothetical protein